MDIFAYLVHKRSLIDIISSFFLFFFLYIIPNVSLSRVFTCSDQSLTPMREERERERGEKRKRGIINRFRFRVRSCKMQSARDVAKLTFNFALDGLE